MGVQVQHAQPPAAADSPGTGHAQVAGESGLVPAAQDSGEMPAVEHCRDGVPGTGLAVLQGTACDFDVPGVEHLAVRMKGKGAQRRAEGSRGLGRTRAALVPPDTFIARKPENHC